MPTTIESLELEIQSKSASAEKGIAALSESLEKLKTATQGLGLRGVSNQLSNINAAAKQMDSSSADKISKLASSLEKLKGLGSIKISTSIGNQIRNISSAVSGLSSANLDALRNLSGAIQPLSSLGKASGLQSAITQLNKLPQLAQTLNTINWTTLTTQLQSLSNALAPLANQLNTVSAAFQKLPANIRKVVTATNAITPANQRAANSYINFWAKARMAYNAVMTGARVIASWITQSNQYIEDVNLFTASMGQYAAEAQTYAERVGELMGIDPGQFMRYQGTFNTIIAGFGVASDKAYLMSKNLTQLGYDLSSFFNISFEDSMQKLQSGISGELEPLRRLGYDLSVARLQQEALNLGITKSVNSMTQAEKSQLRYYAIMTQVTTAQGDMARTLNAPANQLRVLQAQVTQCARALGKIFIPALNAVLPYAIALVKVLRMLAQAIASFFGFELPEVDYSGISVGASAVGDLADNAGSAADGLGDAAKAAKKLKNATLGIDELNIISPNDSSAGGGGGGAGGGGGGLGIGGNDLGIDLPEYDSLAGIVSSTVDEIVEKMKEWLGLTEEINSVGDFLHTRLGHILTTVGSIALGLAAWKISKGVLNALDWVNQLKKHGLTNPLTIAVGISLLVTGVALEWSGIIDTILNELDGENFAQILSGGLITVGGGAFLGKGLAGWITSAFSGSAVANALTTAASNLGLSTVTAAGAALGAGVAGIIAGIPAYFTGIYDAITNGLNWLNGLLIPAGSTAAAAGIGAIIGACGGPIGAGIGALIGLVIGLVTDAIVAIREHWSEITAFFNEFFTETVPGIWSKFTTWVSKLPEEIANFFSGLWKSIKNFDWNGLGHDIGVWFGNAIKSAISFVTVTIPQALSNLWNTMSIAVGTFFTETLPNFFLETIPNAFLSLAEWFVNLGELMWKYAVSGFSWFFEIGAYIVLGIIEGLGTIFVAIGDFIGGLVDGVCEALGINSPSTVFAEIGVFCIQGLFQGFQNAIGSIGEWVKKNIITPVSNAIENNPVTDIVVGIKNTASEWWSGVQTWWDNVSQNGVSMDALVNLVKNRWTTVRNWIGSIPSLDQLIKLAKEKWTTVKNWIGSIPVIEQGIKLVKSLWTTVKNWVGSIPVLSQGISLAKHLWTTVKNWVGSIPVLTQGISLLKSGWSKVSAWVQTHMGGTVSKGISLVKSGWDSVAGWVKNRIGGVVSVTVSLVQGWVGSLKKWLGLSGGGIVGADGGLKVYSQGGSIDRFGRSWWSSVPKYAKGTPSAGSHGSLFVAGEDGAELVGHVNGTTEVLNRFQLASVMQSAVVAGMSQFTGYWRSMYSQMTVCSNAIIRSILVSSDVMYASLATAGGGYDPTNALSQSVYEDSQRGYNNSFSSDSFSRAMREFYQEYVEPTLREIAEDTKRQADKDEQTIVQVGNRTINDAVVTQQRANGYTFVK